MGTVIAFLTFALFIALIIGLVKPALVLQWDKKPSRLKVFLYWIIASILLTVVGGMLISDEEIAESTIESSKSLIENERYDDAIVMLGEIKPENEFFEEAQLLIKEAENLEIESREQRRAESAEADKKAAEESRDQQIEQLQRELESINKGIDFSQYRGNIESLQIEIVLFGTWAKIITDAENSDDKEMKTLAAKLKKKVKQIQIAEFPQLRKEYGKVVGKKMWENDITVTTNGTGARYVNFTGGLFAANKNKKDFQTQLHEVLTMFRFKQSRYRWYEGEDEYTYYTIYEGKDSEVVNF